MEMSAEEIVEELLDGVVAQVEQEVPWRPGAVELLAEPARGRRAVRAGHHVLPAVRRADPAGLPPETFRVIVTGDQVERGKPHPEPYLTAAAALGLAAGRLPGHRGLQHRRHVGRGRRAAWCWSCENHVDRRPGSRERTFRDTSARTDVSRRRRSTDLRLSQARKRCQRGGAAVRGRRGGIGGGVPPKAGHRAWWAHQSQLRPGLGW